jgi:competence ComEA-like helix-hairpin-helix protein
MSRRSLHRFILPPIALTWIVASPVLAQLPDGPGRDEVVKVCGTCHPATTSASVRLTRDGWQTKIAEMVARGAMASDDELAAILDYLATHFLGEASELINVNTATAVQLESVLELLRRESAAFIEYREKTKGFKSLDDMKNIPGVPFKKIESKKDRITFGIKTD